MSIVEIKAQAAITISKVREIGYNPQYNLEQELRQTIMRFCDVVKFNQRKGEE